MNEQDVISRTRQYIEESFPQMRPGFVVGDRDPLFANGIIDSMGAFALVGFLAREFDITVGDDEMTEQNIGTLTDIAQFVISKRMNRGPA